MDYDSTKDTLKHRETVAKYLIQFCQDIQQRALVHDLSKLESPEKEIFDEYTPKLKQSTYGSDEYKGYLEEMGKALKHHYRVNSHHPEHYMNGIDGMNLFDLVEMFFDWKAGSERHADGNIYESIEHNYERFNLSPQLKQIFINTCNYLRWNK